MSNAENSSRSGGGGGGGAVADAVLVEILKFQAPFDRDKLAPQKAIIDGINEKIKSGSKLTRTEKQSLRDTAKKTIEIVQEMERKDMETLLLSELRAHLEEANEAVTLTYQGITLTIKKERG